MLVVKIRSPRKADINFHQSKRDFKKHHFSILKSSVKEHRVEERARHGAENAAEKRLVGE